MEDKELLAELQAGLKEEGIEATEEEIQAAVEKLEEGELSEDNLEDVAGGSIGTGFSSIIGHLRICPRCRMPYITGCCIPHLSHKCKLRRGK